MEPSIFIKESNEHLDFLSLKVMQYNEPSYNAGPT
jgi:hypothetical protein